MNVLTGLVAWTPSGDFVPEKPLANQKRKC
jgi:hypothetical protein